MSQKPNARRGEKRHQDNGSTWEGGPPSSGCNSTHVARARKKWKRVANRTLRRNDKVTPKFMSMAGSSGRTPKPPSK
jgi:hypothetical protein